MQKSKGTNSYKEYEEYTGIEGDPIILPKEFRIKTEAGGTSEFTKDKYTEGGISIGKFAYEASRGTENYLKFLKESLENEGFNAVGQDFFLSVAALKRPKRYSKIKTVLGVNSSCYHYIVTGNEGSTSILKSSEVISGDSELGHTGTHYAHNVDTGRRVTVDNNTYTGDITVRGCKELGGEICPYKEAIEEGNRVLTDSPNLVLNQIVRNVGILYTGDGHTHRTNKHILFYNQGEAGLRSALHRINPLIYLEVEFTEGNRANFPGEIGISYNIKTPRKIITYFKEKNYPLYYERENNKIQETRNGILTTKIKIKLNKVNDLYTINKNKITNIETEIYNIFNDIENILIF